MMREVVSEHARRDIDRLVRRLLRDSGSSEPPVNVEDVLQVLDLDLEFYDLEEPRLLKRVQHRVKVGAKRLAEYLDKIKLQALLLFDDRRVLLDKDLPKVKHDWATAHEAGHRLIPWHRDFWRGDTLETLDPAWHEELEAEANYAASRLLFCGELFTQEAQDTRPCWTTIERLRRRYKKNLHVTARRYVEHGPDLPMVLLVSTAAWDEPPPDQVNRVRHVVLSPSYEALFQPLDPDGLRELVDGCTERRRGGPVGEVDCRLRDRDGEVHVFHGECFYNGYYVMSLFVHQGPAATLVAAGNRALR